MIEANMPQDILKYKTKFIGNFSMRETVCGGIGIAVALWGYFGIFSSFSSTVRMGGSACICLPFLLAGFWKPMGMTFEKALTTIVVDNFIAPAKRKYEVKHPDYIKYLQTGELPKTAEELAKETAEAEAEEETGKKKKKKNKKQKEQKNSSQKKVKIIASKEYKAIK